MFACVLACLVVLFVSFFVFVLFLCLFCFCVCLCLLCCFCVWLFVRSSVRPFVRSFVDLFVCVFVLFSLISFCFASFRLVSCRAVLVGWLVGRSVGRWVGRSVGRSVGWLVVFFPVSSPPSTTVARLWECVSLLFCKATECQPPPPRHCRESAQPAQAKQSPTSIHGLHDAPCVNGHLVRSGSVRRVGTS